MAGDWIKMRVDLGDDPAVIQIAASLDISEDEVVYLTMHVARLEYGMRRGARS